MRCWMSEFQNDAVSWLLPPLFPSDDVVLMDKENAPAAAASGSALKKSGLVTTDTTGLNSIPPLVFPTEFPYELDSADSVLSSPVDSATEAKTTSDEEDFLAGLTQRLTHSSSRKLEKSWVVAGSPESILSGLGSMSVSSNGSPNGSSSLVSSPPTTPFGGENDTWDLISAAAGQIAMLKTSNRTETAPNYTANSHAIGLLAPPKSSSPVHVIKNPNLGFYTSQKVKFDLVASSYQYQQYVKHEQMYRAQKQQDMRPTWAGSQPQQIQNKFGNFAYENARCGEKQLPQSACHPMPVLAHHQQKPQQQRSVFVAGSGCVKRQCAGTGVFLPRRYGNCNNNLHDSRRKSDGPNVLVPHVPQRSHSSFGPNYDAVIARRNAVIALQKRSIRAEAAARNHHEIHLPKEWTY